MFTLDRILQSLLPRNPWCIFPSTFKISIPLLFLNLKTKEDSTIINIDPHMYLDKQIAESYNDHGLHMSDNR